MRNVLIVIGLCLIIACSFVLYQFALTQATYQGLPTVPCLDYTKPIVNHFTFTIDITINNQPYPLEKTFGHDYGNCLHDIFVTDTSGRVNISANDNESFTLGQFFDVWHETFSQNQLAIYQVTQGHTLKVFVNGKQVDTYRKTPLTPNSMIEVVYK